MPGKKYCIAHTMVNAGAVTWTEGEIVDESDLKQPGVDLKRLVAVGAVRVATRDDLAAAKAKADAAALVSDAAPGTLAPVAPAPAAEVDGDDDDADTASGFGFGKERDDGGA